MGVLFVNEDQRSSIVLKFPGKAMWHGFRWIEEKLIFLSDHIITFITLSITSIIQTHIDLN